MTEATTFVLLMQHLIEFLPADAPHGRLPLIERFTLEVNRDSDMVTLWEDDHESAAGALSRTGCSVISGTALCHDGLVARMRELTQQPATICWEVFSHDPMPVDLAALRQHLSEIVGWVRGDSNARADLGEGWEIIIDRADGEPMQLRHHGEWRMDIPSGISRGPHRFDHRLVERVRAMVRTPSLIPWQPLRPVPPDNWTSSR